jgi:hypothetical protein
VYREPVGRVKSGTGTQATARVYRESRRVRSGTGIQATEPVHREPVRRVRSGHRRYRYRYPGDTACGRLSETTDRGIAGLAGLALAAGTVKRLLDVSARRPTEVSRG